MKAAGIVWLRGMYRDTAPDVLWMLCPGVDVAGLPPAYDKTGNATESPADEPLGALQGLLTGLFTAPQFLRLKKSFSDSLQILHICRRCWSGYPDSVFSNYIYAHLQRGEFVICLYVRSLLRAWRKFICLLAGVVLR